MKKQGLPNHTERVVLIVEDFDAIRTILARYFQHLGFEVISAGTIHDALIVAADRTPDVVIVDFDLRGDDPYRAVESVHDAEPESFIVLMNGWTKRSAEEKAKAAGAQQIIERTFDTAVLDGIFGVPA